MVTFNLLDSIHCYFYHGEPVGNNQLDLIKQKLEWERKCGIGAQLGNVSTMLESIDDEDDNKDPYKGYKLIKEKKDLLLFEDPFFYWEYCKPKYNTFKQELLNNGIFKLTELQFNDLLFQSELWYKSIIAYSVFFYCLFSVLFSVLFVVYFVVFIFIYFYLLLFNLI